MNEPVKTENTDIMSIYQRSENILSDIQNITETSQRQAYHAVDTILSQRNWLIGYRIAEEEIDGSDRAEYGANIVKKLSKELTAKYGKGYDRSNLYHCLRFYKRLSTQRVDNPIYGFLGLITVHYYRWQIPLHVIGMRKRHTNRHGVCAHYSAISTRNITTVSCSRSIKNW